MWGLMNQSEAVSEYLLAQVTSTKEYIKDEFTSTLVRSFIPLFLYPFAKSHFAEEIRAGQY